MLVILAGSIAMMVYPKHLNRWGIKNLTMRFRKFLGVDKSWVEAESKFMEKDPVSSRFFWIWRIGGFVFAVLSIIAISGLMLILLGSILDVFR